MIWFYNQEGTKLDKIQMLIVVISFSAILIETKKVFSSLQSIINKSNFYRFGLSCKANQYSDAGTGDLDELSV